MVLLMDIFSFFVYCVIVTATPGPTNIAILSISTNSGIKKTSRYIMGAATALLILLVLSVFFNSILSEEVPKIMLVMQYAGSFYMLYLTYQVFRMNVSSGMSKQAATFLSGFTMQFVNPKIWLLTMTVIPSYVLPYYKKTSVLLGFALIITVIALLAFIAWTLFGRVLIRFLQKYQKGVNIVLALLLLYSAAEVSGVIDLIMR